MAYSTVAQIRQEAGFQNNTNVTDPTIEGYQTRAYNLVRSYVAARYTISDLAGALFTGSQAASVLAQIEILLAAGYLLHSEYQGQPMGEKAAKEKIDEANRILKQLASGELRLLDVNGDEFGTGAVSSEQAGSAEYTAPPREAEESEYSERKFDVDDKY